MGGVLWVGKMQMASEVTGWQPTFVLLSGSEGGFQIASPRLTRTKSLSAALVNPSCYKNLESLKERYTATTLGEDGITL